MSRLPRVALVAPRERDAVPVVEQKVERDDSADISAGGTGGCEWRGGGGYAVSVSR